MIEAMSRERLLEDLGFMLGDVAEHLESPDLSRALDEAANDLTRRRPHFREGQIELEAGRRLYPAPVDLIRPGRVLWGRDLAERMDLWERGRPRRFALALAHEDEGRKIVISPAPTAGEIALLGADFRYRYEASYTIAEEAAATTVQPHDRWLLLLRATAAAMKQIALNNSTRPVELGDGVGPMHRNGTPAGLYDKLMQEFNAV